MLPDGVVASLEMLRAIVAQVQAADIIGLYLHSPAHAAVFCVDEKTAIQALDRKDPVLPLSPGRAERHGFEYFRHGTLSLYAAFNTKNGEALGKTAARHTSAECVAFLADIVVNLSAHKPCRSPSSWIVILAFTCTSLRLTLRGSTRSNSGSLRSSPSHRSRRVHLTGRSAEKAHEVHPPLQ
jgi:hypothetical protein